LENFEHIDILVEDVASNDPRNQQASLYLLAEVLPDFVELNIRICTNEAFLRHFRRDSITS
jgi:hypothetical protein